MRANTDWGKNRKKLFGSQENYKCCLLPWGENSNFPLSLQHELTTKEEKPTPVFKVETLEQWQGNKHLSPEYSLLSLWTAAFFENQKMLLWDWRFNIFWSSLFSITIASVKTGSWRKHFMLSVTTVRCKSNAVSISISMFLHESSSQHQWAEVYFTQSYSFLHALENCTVHCVESGCVEYTKSRATERKNLFVGLCLWSTVPSHCNTPSNNHLDAVKDSFCRNQRPSNPEIYTKVWKKNIIGDCCWSGPKTKLSSARRFKFISGNRGLRIDNKCLGKACVWTSWSILFSVLEPVGSVLKHKKDQRRIKLHVIWNTANKFSDPWVRISLCFRLAVCHN